MKLSEKTAPQSRSATPENLLLSLLLEGARDGYQLNRTLQQDLNQIWRLSQSQLYATLKRLEARGWVAGTQTPSRRGLPRRVFELTEAGRKQAEEWLIQPSPCSVQVVRLDLPARLYVLRRIRPEAIEPILADQRRVLMEGLQRLQNQLDRIPESQPFNRMACEIRVNQVQALLKWFDQKFLNLEI
ncbi:transcriptional regulator, PadR family [Bellilinea caldifistulae]|uniref:PadR family transcriptional regulator n=1 Tax=Bellilinea caldifistulae TaxID=360411 RepID=UPI00078316F5|nr:PadR family transcriptional regulator [Bellilinea caldifistulae]GAP09625.1 transcriptional regulator, PadR family [Bellilinea caldifistulae]